MGSVGEFEQAVMAWLNRVETLAGRIDGGRARLAVHDPLLLTLQPALQSVAMARTAKDTILTALRKRMTDYPIGRSVRSGQEWTELRARFVAACGSVQSVGNLLVSDVAILLHVDSCLPSQNSAPDLVRLTSQQLDYLRNAQDILIGSTSRVLNNACSLFEIGQRNGVLYAAFTQALNTNQ